MGSERRRFTEVDIQSALDALATESPRSRRRSGSTPDRQFFGSYQIISMIGEGGAAQVLRVRHIHPNYAERMFALKLLHREDDPQTRVLFRKEAYLMALLQHPNVVGTFEAGVEEGRMFIVMEYISGRDLWDLTDRARQLQTTLAYPVLMHVIGETLRGLTFAHDLKDPDGGPLGIIHHDVNPTNVFISFDGEVKLGDFGVAAITTGAAQEEESAGKVGYFAPEQFTRQHLDQRVDVFSMGVTMFELLCGVAPFEAENQEETLRLNAEAIVPQPRRLKPELNAEVEAIILKALARKASDRFHSAQEMLSALEPHLPPRRAMQLAVAASVRTLMLHEYVEELQLRRGLLGGSKDDGVGNDVTLLSPRPQARRAWRATLGSRGFAGRDFADAVALEADSAGAGQTADALVVDVNDALVDPLRIAEAVSRAPHVIPIVAAAASLSPEVAERARALGAMDLVYEPLLPDRVQTALWVAIMSGGQRPAPAAASPSGGPTGTRILLVSGDAALGQSLPEALSQWRYATDVVATEADAIDATRRATYHAVIYDLAEDQHARAADFAQRFRACEGMGLIPLLYLAAHEDPLLAGAAGAAPSVGVTRSVVRDRGDAPVVLANTLNQLRSDVRSGRSFIRYSAAFDVEMRYSGRNFVADAVDVSRGGIMLRCDEMPPVGTLVNLSLRLPKHQNHVEVPGRVVRVDLPKAGQSRPGVGIEFGGLGARHESALIGFLYDLSAEAAAR